MWFYITVSIVFVFRDSQSYSQAHEWTKPTTKFPHRWIIVHIHARQYDVQVNQHSCSNRGVKCHTDRRSERLLLGTAEGWIKASPLSSYSTNWCCGISPQGQELGQVEAADAPVKEVKKKCSEKWQNWENVRHTHTTKLSMGMQLCDVCLLWYHSVAKEHAFVPLGLLTSSVFLFLLHPSLSFSLSPFDRHWWVWRFGPAM